MISFNDESFYSIPRKSPELEAHPTQSNRTKNQKKHANLLTFSRAASPLMSHIRKKKRESHIRKEIADDLEALAFENAVDNYHNGATTKFEIATDRFRQSSREVPVGGEFARNTKQGKTHAAVRAKLTFDAHVDFGESNRTPCQQKNRKAYKEESKQKKKKRAQGVRDEEGAKEKEKEAEKRKRQRERDANKPDDGAEEVEGNVSTRLKRLYPRGFGGQKQNGVPPMQEKNTDGKNKPAGSSSRTSLEKVPSKEKVSLQKKVSSNETKKLDPKVKVKPQKIVAPQEKGKVMTLEDKNVVVKDEPEIEG
jgi:hypothetical protein